MLECARTVRYRRALLAEAGEVAKEELVARAPAKFMDRVEEREAREQV